MIEALGWIIGAALVIMTVDIHYEIMRMVSDVVIPWALKNFYDRRIMMLTMTTLFVMAAVTGFLLTAIPNWTGRLPAQGRPLATGRDLTANRAIVATFVLINLAAVTRVCASWHPVFMTALLALAAACWIAAFALFEIVYGPMLLTRNPAHAGSAP